MMQINTLSYIMTQADHAVHSKCTARKNLNKKSLILRCGLRLYEYGAIVPNAEPGLLRREGAGGQGETHDQI